MNAKKSSGSLTASLFLLVALLPLRAREPSRDGVEPSRGQGEPWLLPTEPDQVIPMRSEPFRVPVRESADYWYFVVDPQWREDHWVSAAEVAPGNQAIVHEAHVFVRPPSTERWSQLSWLAGSATDDPLNAPLASGRARLVPARSVLVFQLRYLPADSEREDLTKLGLQFANPVEVTTEVRTIVLEKYVDSPPSKGVTSVTLTADEFPAGSHLVAVSPRLGRRGKAVQIRARSENGTKTLWSLSNYDFRRKQRHELKDRPPLEGRQVECVLSFHSLNRRTEGASGPERPQARLYLDVALPAETSKEGESPSASRTREPSSVSATARQTRMKRAREIAERFFRELDLNEDRQIARQEAPEAFRVFAFKRLDLDKNESLSWAEVLGAAWSSLNER